MGKYATFFARLYEINDAFLTVGKLVEKQGIVAFEGKGECDKIVSQCLDLLELIYLYGGSARLEVRNINFESLPGQEAFERFIVSDFYFDNSLQGNTHWSLFYWDGKVVGGVSPFTLVYTAPNIELSSLNLRGTNGNILFGNTPVSLLERGREFQAYIITNSCKASNISNEFKGYCEICGKFLRDRIVNIPILALDYLRPVRWNVRDIYIGDPDETSDYKIEPDKFLDKGKKPLMLTPEGVPGALYWREMYWNPSFSIRGKELSDDLKQRELPGTAYMYPFLVAEDLFEDVLMEIVGISQAVSCILQIDERYFLIPIKRMYFEFFDLCKLFYRINVEKENDTIIVSLLIPLQNNRNNIIRKIYRESDIKFCEDFFLLMSSNKEKSRLNKMVSSYPIKLLYTKDLCVFPCVEERKGDGYVFLEAENIFDVIEVRGGECTGLIVRALRPIMESNLDLVFCVECGVDGTKIAYSDSFYRLGLIEEEDIDKSLLCIGNQWKEAASMDAVKMIELEFYPNKGNSPLLTSYSYDEFCQRMLFMIKNVAVEIFSTSNFKLKVVYSDLLSNFEVGLIKTRWVGLPKVDACEMMSSEQVMIDYHKRRYLGHNEENVACLDLGESDVLFSFNKDDKVIRKRSIFSSSYYWGVTREIDTSSSFIKKTLAKYWKSTVSCNQEGVEEEYYLSYNQLLGLLKGSGGHSDFYNYINKDGLVKLKSLVYLSSILFYLYELHKEYSIKTQDIIYIYGQGLQLIQMLGDEELCSRFATNFLSELAGEPQKMRIKYVSNEEKVIAGLVSEYKYTNEERILEYIGEREGGVNNEEVALGRENCIASVRAFVELLNSRFIQRNVYELFELDTKKLKCIYELAPESYDYNVRELFNERVNFNLIKTDLFFVALLDFFELYEIDKGIRGSRNLTLKNERNVEKSEDKEVFISYKREELDLVRRIKDEIEKETGCKCWIDLEGIDSGDDFTKRIVSAINKSNVFLFMLSEKSQKSDFALKELGYAKSKEDRARNRYVVLVNIDSCEMEDVFFFDYGKLDRILYADKIQKQKLLQNLKSWLKKGV